MYLVGSRHEGYGETGMAHLLEHMNFIKSTHDRNIKKELEDHGASWNGTTYYDRTNYYETVNASDDNLQWALGLEAERMVNMRIEKPLLDTEMTVVRNEFERGENSVARRSRRARARRRRFSGTTTASPRSARAPTSSACPIDRLAAFYQKYYQPDNAVLTIAGQIDPARTLAMVARTLGAIPRPTRTLDDTYTVEPPQDGERSVELRRVGKGKNLIMAYHTPAMAHPGRRRARSDVRHSRRPRRHRTTRQGAGRHQEGAVGRTCRSRSCTIPASSTVSAPRSATTSRSTR